MDKKFSRAKVFSIFIIIIVLLAIVAALENFQSTNALLKSSDANSSSSGAYVYATTTISAPKGNIVVQIADTTDTETQGLSDRTSLPEGTGMLFAFDSESPQYMWMKDMNFSLDMVWLDQNKKVVYIATDVTPQSYTQNPPQIFYSPTDALYVIEIPSGDANRLGIELGETLSFTVSH